MGEHPGLPLPSGARLLHIGPHKTGTTSLQGAFHLSRSACLAQGVRYAGPNRHPVGAAQEVVASAGRPSSFRLWPRLVREVRRAREPRVVISSEWFADADDVAIGRIVGDLDRSRIQVVVTVRPLELLLPSQWQQYAQAGNTVTYERWLEQVLGDDPDAAAAFWRRHRHDELVRRWAGAVGADRITVVVADDRDHGAILRAFEALTGLRPGTLRAEPAGWNRSLTEPEIDVVRAINGALTDAGVAAERRLALGLYGAAAALRQRVPPDAEPRVRTPEWAVARANAIGAEIAEGIAAAHVRVIGDLAQLGGRESAGGEPAGGELVLGRAGGRQSAGQPGRIASPIAAPSGSDPEVDWAAIAATAVVGAATTAGLLRRWPGMDRRRELDGLSAARLREVLAARSMTALRRRLLQPPTDIDGPAAATRPFTTTEATAMAAIEAALRERGVGRRASDGVLAPIAHEVRGGAADGAATQSEQWSRFVGAAALGIARAGDLLPRAGAAAPRRRRRETVETIELAGVSTVGLAAVLAARMATRAVARLGVRRRPAPSDAAASEATASPAPAD